MQLAKRIAHLRTSAAKLWTASHPSAADALLRAAVELEERARSADA